MRCPKCGYISFDHVSTCLKCNKDISKTAPEIEGTTYNVTPPSFLKFQKSGESSQREEDETVFDDLQGERDVIDPDLDVLVDEDDSEEDAGISFGEEFEGFDNLGMEEEIELSDEDEGEEIGLDLGQFEDAFESEEPAGEEDEFELEMPDELADISDLSPPAEEPEEEEALPASPAEFSPAEESVVEEDDFALDLDLEDMDEDFSLVGEESAEGDDEEDPLGDLSLDDLGLSEGEDDSGPAAPARKKPRDDMDMDADLDFDLDLGGLSLDDDDKD